MTKLLIVLVASLLLPASLVAQESLSDATLTAFLGKLDASEGAEAGGIKELFLPNAIILTDFLDPKAMKMTKKCLTLDEYVADVKVRGKEMKGRSVKRELIEAFISSDGQTAVCDIKLTEGGSPIDGQVVSRTWKEVIFVTHLNVPRISALELRASNGQ